MFPPIYTTGPLPLLANNHLTDNKLNYIGSNLWKEQSDFTDWFDLKEPNSVTCVNFGSITVQTPQQMLQFAWDLANSIQPFLWIIRPVVGGCESRVLPPEFLAETRGRGNLASWCPQEEILKHPSIGGFASHMEWKSMLESVSCGVSFLCWPFFL